MPKTRRWMTAMIAASKEPMPALPWQRGARGEGRAAAGRGLAGPQPSPAVAAAALRAGAGAGARAGVRP